MPNEIGPFVVALIGGSVLRAAVIRSVDIATDDIRLTSDFTTALQAAIAYQGIVRDGTRLVAPQ